ncbi:uncharacterized protein LOC117781912 [Drosophila innubila]|uniref:uncharacterized protein LOC117781912 n=1 Tax=Drosophila innubila TaxID=198719 RepID=UPI00148C66F6|nr:uncharacterized protein LOC117781912 [Drosophila innubila]
MKSRRQVVSAKSARTLSESDQWSTHGALELEAAAALLMLRYQYDVTKLASACTVPQMTPPSPSPPPPPAATEMPIATTVAETDKCTPKEQVRSVAMADSSQPLKKRSIPPHLLRRSLTPARSPAVGSGAITKAKLKVPAAPCNKALLKSCRNMIREFLDNQELF